jgi:glycosyltransferase involved in cell wall biosynthesis
MIASASPSGSADTANSDFRVLFHTYDWAFQRPGGGEVQLMKTQEHLEQLGVRVDRFDRWSTRLQDYPLVHSFSLLPYEFWGPVKLAGCALAVSTIHWPYVPEPSLRSQLKQAIVKTGKRLLRMPEDPGKPFHHVDIFFPNSQMEADLLCRAYQLDPARMHVVPNGVEERFAEATPDLFVREYGLKDFILCVGRVDGRKNQLTLVRALKDLGRPIVCIGEPVLGEEPYLEQCKREGGPNAHFLGKIDHRSPLLESAYAAASVLVLPSYIETPGLCALEAGLAGTPLVVTELGCTREYFGEHAAYVHPSDPEGIRAAVRKVLDNPPDTRPLRERIHSRYLWRHAAAATRAGYEKALAARAERGGAT